MCDATREAVPPINIPQQEGELDAVKFVEKIQSGATEMLIVPPTGAGWNIAAGGTTE
jgi:hypothetical protein